MMKNALFRLHTFNMDRGHSHQHSQNEGDYQERHANMERKTAHVKKPPSSTGYHRG